MPRRRAAAPRMPNGIGSDIFVAAITAITAIIAIIAIIAPVDGYGTDP